MSPARKQWLRAALALMAVLIVAGLIGWALGGRHHPATGPGLRALQVPVQTVHEGALPDGLGIAGAAATRTAGTGTRDGS